MAFSKEDEILIEKNTTTERLHCYPFS